MPYNDTKYSNLLGSVDLKNIRKERMISDPHPMTSQASWYTKHPPICPQNTSSHVVVALCLFGVPGVVNAKAGLFIQNKGEFIKNVANHFHFIRHTNINVFSHAWQHPKHRNDCFLQTKPYGNRLKTSQCEDLITSEHIHSMLISMSRVLLMNRDYEQAKHMIHDHVILMRHDTKFCTELPFTFNPMYLVISDNGWGAAQNPLDGIYDYMYIASSIFLEYVFGTLLERIEKKEIVHTNMRAHFVVQSHFDDLFISGRQFVRSYNFSSTLWRASCKVYRNDLCVLPRKRGDYRETGANPYGSRTRRVR